MNALDGVIIALNLIGSNIPKTKSRMVRFDYEIKDEEIGIYVKRELDNERIKLLSLKRRENDEGIAFGAAAAELIEYMMYAKDSEFNTANGATIKTYSKETIFSRDLNLKLN